MCLKITFKKYIAPYLSHVQTQLTWSPFQSQVISPKRLYSKLNRNLKNVNYRGMTLKKVNYRGINFTYLVRNYNYILGYEIVRNMNTYRYSKHHSWIAYYLSITYYQNSSLIVSLTKCSSYFSNQVGQIAIKQSSLCRIINIVNMEPFQTYEHMSNTFN